MFVTLFRLHKTFSFLFSYYLLSHNIFFSQFPHLHLISRFVLSLFCRISSRCTNRTQSIHPPPYLVPLLREPPSRPLPLILTHQSHNATTLITSTSSLFLALSLFVLSTLLARAQFRTSLPLIYLKN